MNRLRNDRRGISLAELLIAGMIISIIAIAAAAAFKLIMHNTQTTKTRTLATNLAQEKIQILKQQNYYRLYATAAPETVTLDGTAVAYDPTYYPPESLLEGGIRFTRYTHLQVAQEDGSGGILLLPPTTPDTGMKQITVTVSWNQGAQTRFLQIRNMASNPDLAATNVVLTGTVRNASTLTPIDDAVVNVAENVGWRSVTDASGQYRMTLNSGSYNLAASAPGYFPALIPRTLAANSTVSQDFDLAPMSSGTVRGYVWRNDHIVVSQVVGSTESSTGFDQEYIELYNPTTGYVQMVVGMNAFLIKLMHQKAPGQPLEQIYLDYAVMNSSIPPGGYYLIANTPSVQAGGVTRTADAVYKNTPMGANVDYPNILKVDSIDGADNDAQALVLIPNTGTDPIDAVGWKGGGGHTPDYYESQPINQHLGLEREEQYVRRSDPGGVTPGIGRAYDSGDNSIDWVVNNSITAPPKNTSDVEPITTGIPAAGAIISANDGLSTPVVAQLTGSPPSAYFDLVSVATGTCYIAITSGTSYAAIDQVTVTPGGITWVPNASTTPPWPAAGSYNTVLSSTAYFGFVAGRVTSVAGTVISPLIAVTDDVSTVNTNASGRYFLMMSTGTGLVTANPNNGNSTYVSQAQNVTVDLGQITSDVNFTLSQGGLISGHVTRDGINPLPGIGLVALDSLGAARSNVTSDANGRFLMVNLTTGAYTVEPVLDSGEISSPVSAAATVTAGTTVSVGTFTIAGAFGTVTGNVTQSGSAIKTGVLVVISTAAIPSSGPPALSTATLAAAPYYVGSSMEDGTYQIAVRGGSDLYQATGYYTTFNGTIPTTSTRSVTGISVTAGVTTSGVNFSW